PVAVSVSLGRSRAGAHGGGSGRMAAAVPRRGPGVWGGFRALLRTAGHSLAVAAVHFGQLRVCERDAPTDTGARVRSAGVQPLRFDRDRASADGNWARRDAAEPRDR